MSNSNTTLVKVKLTETQLTQLETNYSNTTLVKVKSQYNTATHFICYSNTTLVKVKLSECLNATKIKTIQIQHLLKLNSSSASDNNFSAGFKYNTC